MNSNCRIETRRIPNAIMRALHLWLVTGFALGAAACSLDGLTGSETLPLDMSEPEAIESPRGAVAAYNGVVAQFRRVFAENYDSFVAVSGHLSDEFNSTDIISLRQLPEGSDGALVIQLYSNLHKVRGQANQVVKLLELYAPDTLQMLRAHVHSLAGYAEIFLADAFCSGVPLSTIDFDGDFSYARPSTTAEVYQHAINHFELARTHAGDSTRFDLLARIGTARALLALGDYDSAAAVVSDVPDEFRYEVSYRPAVVGDAQGSNIFRLNVALAISDSEGLNGLDYITSEDPRAQFSQIPGPSSTVRYFPDKYSQDGSSPILLASGIEARLIEAEAALNSNDPAWLDKLNHLRQTMWTTIVPAVGGPLPDLVDPGTDDARVDLLFRERAFWLFLTGQRQGDMRRLIRHYGRTQNQVYPIGPYTISGIPDLSYGSDVDLPIPNAERVSNPYFNGCLSRGA